MVTVKKVNKQNLCDDLIVENLKQARRIAALEAEVASLRINQQPQNCGNCLLAGECTYYGFSSDSCGYSARV